MRKVLAGTGEKLDLSRLVVDADEEDLDSTWVDDIDIYEIISRPSWRTRIAEQTCSAVVSSSSS